MSGGSDRDEKKSRGNPRTGHAPRAAELKNIVSLLSSPSKDQRCGTDQTNRDFTLSLRLIQVFDNGNNLFIYCNVLGVRALVIEVLLTGKKRNKISAGA